MGIKKIETIFFENGKKYKADCYFKIISINSTNNFKFLTEIAIDGQNIIQKTIEDKYNILTNYFKEDSKLQCIYNSVVPQKNLNSYAAEFARKEPDLYNEIIVPFIIYIFKSIYSEKSETVYNNKNFDNIFFADFKFSLNHKKYCLNDIIKKYTEIIRKSKKMNSIYLVSKLWENFEKIFPKPSKQLASNINSMREYIIQYTIDNLLVHLFKNTNFNTMINDINNKLTKMFQYNRSISKEASEKLRAIFYNIIIAADVCFTFDMQDRYFMIISSLLNKKFFSIEENIFYEKYELSEKKISLNAQLIGNKTILKFMEKSIDFRIFFYDNLIKIKKKEIDRKYFYSTLINILDFYNYSIQNYYKDEKENINSTPSSENKVCDSEFDKCSDDILKFQDLSDNIEDKIISSEDKNEKLKKFNKKVNDTKKLFKKKQLKRIIHLISKGNDINQIMDKIKIPIKELKEKLKYIKKKNVKV
ncbi:MAG TPA: hypothetical protein PKY81_09195 [bacterium]|nr:hypothetical protein [bacterium]